jgi:hypothetical protein
MVAKTDHLGAAAFIKYEQGGDLSRETLTIASGSGKLFAGTVLGQITVGGKYKPYDNNNSDGSETAKAILVYDVDATSADAAAVCIVRLAEVWKSRLVWAATVLDAEKAPAYTELATSMVIAR